MHAVLVPMVALGGAKVLNHNELELRASPRMQTLNIGQGGNVVLLMVEIKGPETEEWYCPKIEWEFPNGTIATEESDCPTFEKRYECVEDQRGCGLTGFYLDPVTERYVDKRKDCPCTIIGYPRLWSRRIKIGQSPVYGENDPGWVVRVRLIKSDKTLRRETINFWVK